MKPKTSVRLFVAFSGNHLCIRDDLDKVVIHCKKLLDAGESSRIALYDDLTGRNVDIDFSGSEADVLARMTQAEPKDVGHPPENHPRPGRPRLGVVNREISLLPRHWQWLSDQKGSASATLRRLVDAARKSESNTARNAIDAANRFMWDIAGNQPGFEEASRALYAVDFALFRQRITAWPECIRAQLERYIERAEVETEIAAA